MAGTYSELINDYVNTSLSSTLVFMSKAIGKVAIVTPSSVLIFHDLPCEQCIRLFKLINFYAYDSGRSPSSDAGSFGTPRPVP